MNELRTCRCGGAQIEAPVEYLGPVTCGAPECGGVISAFPHAPPREGDRDERGDLEREERT